MKAKTLLLGSLVLCSAVFGQTVFNWVNAQYRPLIISTGQVWSALHLNGNVKSISEEIYLENPLENRNITKKLYTFNPNGKIEKIVLEYSNGIKNIHGFKYNADATLKHHVFLDLAYINGKFDTLVLDTFQTIMALPVADMEIKSSTGLTVYYKWERDEVYTSFDKYGRKSRDSVVLSPTNMAHTIKYYYKGKKVVAKETHLKNELKFKTIYKTDAKGNWIKKVIYCNKRKVNTSVRVIEYFDE